MNSRSIKRGHLLVLLIIPVFWFVLTNVFPHSVHYWATYWWMVPIAFLIAVTVNTVGISGAALFVPFFALIFPLIAEPLTALQSVKLGLITESFGLTSSALAFYLYGLVDRRLAFFSVLGALPFVATGALTAVFLPQGVLLFLVASSLLIAVYMLHYSDALKKMRESQCEKDHVDISVAAGHLRNLKSIDGKKFTYCLTKKGYRRRFFGFGMGGFFQGSAGFGIGEMGVISMLTSQIPVRISIGTSHFVVAFTAITAALIHIFESNAIGAVIPWNILFITVPSVILGGQLAPYLAAKLPKESIEKFISILFFIIAAALVILAFKK